MSCDIDFVVTWLDSSDPAWQAEFQQYSEKEKGHKEAARFRNMGIFHYWFRAVERYASWVRKVFLITNGKFPDWINREHPKLVLVKHSDYMPAEILPTFNSLAIEMHMHRIKGLSEHFVYFNDDVILNAPVTPEYYFRNGLPCDNNRESFNVVPTYKPGVKFGITLNMLANIGILNAHFNRWESVCQSPRRWYGSHLGLSGVFLSCLLRNQKNFIGFPYRHFEQPFLKSVLEEVWKSEPKFMRESCTRFRVDNAATQYLFRYWQFASNRFWPVSNLRGVPFYYMRQDILEEIERTLNNSRVLSVCLNDSPEIKDDEFEAISRGLHDMLERKFPEKSAFEI